MANNKMLIDASHREETRVVVVRGNRIEEFDFEAQERRQLRGNIYLAKVTRVEPSLQAAFIDYGGNRHGFLAFSEIHPDYYQIPAADRQALLDAEEAEAARDAEQEDDDAVEVSPSIDDALNENGDDEDDAQPKKRSSRRKSRRGGRSRKARDDSEASEENSNEKSGDNFGDGDNQNSSDDKSDTPVTADASSDASPVEASAEGSAPVEQVSEEEKPAKAPRKRTRRPKKVAQEAPAENNEAADGTNDESQGNDGESGKSMAAMMDIDSISEPAPDEEDDSQSSDAESSSEEETAPKKKTRRSTRRKPAKKAEAEVEAVSDDTAVEASGDVGEAESLSDDTPEGETSEEEKPKKTRKTSRARKAPRKKSKAEDETNADENGDGEDSDADANDENGDSVESVGQEDAQEEVPVRRPRRNYKIQEVVRRRQVMLVQVVKEERGNKGAALTTYLSLAGRYSVLMPNTARGGGISRKITNTGDRKRLKEIANSLEVPKGMGVILRTAGASRDKEEIRRDFEYLMRLWENVRNLTLESSAPFLVYEEGSLIKRSIRDLYNKDIGEIIVSGENGYAEARNFMQMMMPEHVKNVKYYQGEQSLLSKFNVESQLEKMVTPQVTLKSGGYLIINQTEALVAIDVNSGRSTKEHSIEATALQTNLEAAEEVARQLRLRDLAGLVVIDFIDMEEKRNNRSVERKLKDCLKNDRARIQVGHISHFGLMEMSRQRIRASVLESTMAVCPVCEGVGHVRSESSFAIHVLRSIDDHLSRHSRFDVTVKVAPATAMFILNQKRQAVSELEDRYGVSITFEGDFHMQVHEFTVEKGAPATRVPVQQKAVNPMEFADEDENSSDAKSDDEERNSKRGKRRRGRGRGRGRDREENNNENAGNGENAPSNESQNGNSAGVDENISDANALADVESGSAHIEEVKADETAEAPEQDRKPSRGRRPRKAKSDSKTETSVPAPETVSDEKVEAVKAPVENTQPVETSEPEEPKRRTGRPGKKPASVAVVETPVVEASAGDNETVSTQSAGAPPREVKRRNTKRVSKPLDESAVDSDDENKPTSFNEGFLS